MAKITTLPQAMELIRKLREENETLRLKAIGKRSDGTIDRYTEMEANELRELVIKRSGDPDSIVRGLHSRQRSIAMREWLREHPAKGGTATKKPAAKVTATKKPARRVVEEAPVKKPKRPAKPEPAPVARKKPSAKPAAKPAAKPKRTGRSMD